MPGSVTNAAATSTAASLARLCVVEMGGIRQLGRRAVVDGELAGVERGGAELALLVDGVENDVEARLAVRREPPLLGHRDHALQRLEACIGRLHAAPHLLHGEEPAAHFDIR